MKAKINFKDYAQTDVLDKEEQEIWDDLQNNKYTSIVTEKLKTEYAEIFVQSSKRDKTSNIRLTQLDTILAKAKAKEYGIPFQVLLSSIVHRFLHGKLKEV